jgi:GxxExxY protein
MKQRLSYRIIGRAMEVYNQLGPGLLESAYELALKHELEEEGLKVETQVPLHLHYKGEDLGMVYRMDMIVNDTIIIELKSLETLQPVHYKQLKTYLKLKGSPVGLLINFGEEDFSKGIKRIVMDYNEADNL